MSAQGLEKKMPEVVADLNAARRQPFDPVGQKWRPTTLAGYLAERQLTKQHLYAGLGVDAQRTTVKELYEKEGGAHLMNEVIYDCMLRGQGVNPDAVAQLAPQTSFNDITNPVHRALTPEFITRFLPTYSIEQAIYQGMIAGSAPTPSETVSAPYLDFSSIGGKDTAEAADAEMGNFTISRKDVKCQKVTTGIEVTYETIQSSTLNILGTFFEAFGRMHAAKKNGKLMSVIVSGNPVTADSAPVIGIGTANTPINRDAFRIRQRMVLCGYNPSIVAAEEEAGLAYLDLPAVQSKQNTGMELLPTRSAVGVLGKATYFPSFDLAANRWLFLDPTAAVVEYVFMAFMLETDKIITKQISQAVASESQCFVKQIRQAAVLVGLELAFSGNGWPAYMKPIRSA